MAYPMGPGYAVKIERLTPRNKIVDYLIHNHEQVLETAKFFTKQRDELFQHNNKDWREKIQKQYIHMVMYAIAEQITFEYGIDTETIITFFESFDFEQYISGTPCLDCI
jgi:hypothetical protein